MRCFGVAPCAIHIFRYKELKAWQKGQTIQEYRSQYVTSTPAATQSLRVPHWQSSKVNSSLCLSFARSLVLLVTRPPPRLPMGGGSVAYPISSTLQQPGPAHLSWHLGMLLFIYLLLGPHFPLWRNPCEVQAFRGAHLLPHLLPRSPHSLLRSPHSLTRSLAHSLAHSLTHSRTHSLTRFSLFAVLAAPLMFSADIRGAASAKNSWTDEIAAILLNTAMIVRLCTRVGFTSKTLPPPQTPVLISTAPLFRCFPGMSN